LYREVLDGRYLVVSLTVAGLLIVQYFFTNNVFSITTVGYTLEFPIEELVLATILIIAFTSWLRTSVFYGFSSSFGRFFTGVMVFLSLKAIASLVYILGYVVSEVYGIFWIIHHFFNVASYLPLYASLIIAVFESHNFLKTLASQDKVYGWVIVYGLPAIVWLYFVFFVFKTQAPYLNPEALVSFITSTVYFVLDIITLVLLVPLLSSRFREGILQRSIEGTMLAIVIFSLADIFGNTIFILGEHSLLHTISYSTYALAYILIIPSSRILLGVTVKTARNAAKIRREPKVYDISELTNALKAIIGKCADDVFKALGIVSEGTTIGETELLKLKRMLETILSKPVAEKILEEYVKPLGVETVSVEEKKPIKKSSEFLAVNALELNRISVKLLDPMFLSDIILNSKTEALRKFKVNGIDVREIFSKTLLREYEGSFLILISSPKDFESKILIDQEKIRAAMVKKADGQVLLGFRALQFLRKYTGEVEVIVYSIHKK